MAQYLQGENMTKPSRIDTPYEVQACGDCDCYGKRLGSAIQVELDFTLPRIDP